MSLIELMMAAEAARAQTAVRRTAYRHHHLSDAPLVVVTYNLSGEAAAPLGIMYGTDPDPSKASLAVAAEPRNRDSRFGAINAFAEDFVEFIRPFLTLKTVPTKAGGFRQVAGNAPQLVVPNRGTRAYLGARLGRSLRYLGMGSTHAVPDATQWTGSHLSWLAEHANLPGQSTFLAMTESLSQHFVTGQSVLENENLATLLAWIEGVPGDLLPALEALEDQAFGPVPNPQWEATLEPHVKAYTEGLRANDDELMRVAFEHVEREVLGPLAVAYAATHRSVEILRVIEPAASVRSRWEADVTEWSDHARRCAQGIPRFARRHDALRAAKTLQRWTSAASQLETQQAFDDPMIMAGFDAEGRCVSGSVTAIDNRNLEIKPGGRNRSLVPIIELSLTSRTRLLAGEVVRWTADQSIKGVLRSVDNTAAVVAVMGGAKAWVSAGAATGSELMFVGFDPWEGPDPWSPDETPWTHRETTSELAGDAAGDVDSGADDDSPDLSLDELVAIPIVGAVGPDAEPGALQ
jgi:hypothetical protein